MTKDEFLEWRNHPGTINLFKYLSEMREAFLDSLVSGATINDAGLTGRHVGVIEGLDYALNTKWEDGDSGVREDDAS